MSYFIPTKANFVLRSIKDHTEAKKRHDAFQYLMGNIDGKTDLLNISEKAGLDIELFDRPVKEFLRTGLMKIVPLKRNH